jgi:pSer/pThr/pTyr-binding forkhead associated (FHA) protein
MGMKSRVFGKEAVIGRDPKLAQIVIKHDPVAGRQHASLKQNAQGLWVIEDMKSQNGTTVNGIQISEPVTLQSNDRIGVGMTELVFIDKRRGAL